MASSPAGRASFDSLASPSPRTKQEKSQYPFPDTSNPRSAKSHSRRTSTASSIGGVLHPNAQRNEAILETAQNAISTLLHPPIVRTGLIPHTALPTSSGFKAPTAKDIPPVTLSNITQVNSTIFRNYLSRVGPLYDSLQKAKPTENDAASSPLKSRQSPGGHRGSIGKAETGMVSPMSPVVSPQRSLRSGSNMTSKRPGLGMTPLSTIPSVYFDQDFHLENPRTFDVVSERSDVIRPLPGASSNGINGNSAPPNDRKALATNAILQEKLSWYMDTVEVHLISSISTASSSFFAALGSLRGLQQEAADSVNKIRDLRVKLKRLDDEMAVGGLKIVAMRRRRENLQKLSEAVQQLHAIVQKISECEKLLDTGDVDQAMDKIEDTERLMAGELPLPDGSGSGRGSDVTQSGRRLRDLQGIPALEGAVMEIENLRLRAGKAFEDRFLDALLLDLRSHVNKVPVAETFQRWGSALQRARGDHNRKPSGIPTYLNLDRDVRQVLLANLNGLGRSNHLMPATTAYRESVLRQIKSLIRGHLPSSTDDDADSMISASTHSSRALSRQEKTSILARNMRNLEPEDADRMLTKIYAGVGETLRRLSTQTKVLLDITSGLGSPPPSAGLGSPHVGSPSVAAMDGYLAARGLPGRAISPGRMQIEINQALDMSSLLGQAVDTAQGQIVRILKVRSEPSIDSPLSSFLRYFMLNRLFADECEAVSGRGGSALKSVVNGHISDFVSKFASSQRQELLLLMDKDRWDAVEVGKSDRETIARVLEGSTKDTDMWLREGRIWETNAEDATDGEVPNGTSAASEGGVDVVIDEQKFILPSSALAVLRGIDDFEHLISGIPSMTLEVGSALLEYLKLFNSRSSQLILGAGATRSAGLKNITTKHLALASQALSFIIALVPYVREFARRHAPSATGMLGEFDKAKRLYQDHQTGIHDKLIDIMSGQATVHVRAFKDVDWSKPRDEVNDYMERLAKQTTTFHRVLTKLLPALTVTLIMTPIFQSYREQWGKAFADADVVSDAEKERLIRDAQHFQTSMSRLSGSGDVGDYIMMIVKAKTVTQPQSAGLAADSAVPLSGTRSGSPKKGEMEGE